MSACRELEKSCKSARKEFSPMSGYLMSKTSIKSVMFMKEFVCQNGVLLW